MPHPPLIQLQQSEPAEIEEIFEQAWPCQWEDVTGSGTMDAKEDDDIDLFAPEEEGEEAETPRRASCAV